MESSRDIGAHSAWHLSTQGPLNIQRFAFTYGGQMEITRREALMSAVLPLLQVASSNAVQTQRTPPADGAVFQHDLPNLTMDGWQVTVNTITLAPGSVGNAHRHPGFVLVY